MNECKAVDVLKLIFLKFSFMLTRLFQCYSFFCEAENLNKPKTSFQEVTT